MTVATKDFDPIAKAELSQGSRFKIVFDFKRKECSAYHNDKFCGVFAENIPEKVTPVIGFHWSAAVTSTKFGPLQ